PGPLPSSPTRRSSDLGSRRRYARVGDVIVVSVKEAIPNSRVKKGDVQRAVVVRTKAEIPRPDGSYIKFDRNSAVLINKEMEPIGDRKSTRLNSSHVNN